MAEQSSTDSVLGNQGTQDFSALISGAPQQAPAGGTGSGPTQSDPNARSDGAGGVPRKHVSATEGVEPTPAPDGTSATPPGTPTTPVGTPSPAQPPGTPAANQALVDSLTESMVAASKAAQDRLAANQPPAQPQGPAELTPQQFAAKYKVAQPTTDLITKLVGQDPVVAAQALHAYGQNIVQQTILMTMDLVDAQMKERFDGITPHIDSWKQHQAVIREEKARTQFYEKYADLKDEADLVNDMKDAVIARINSGQVRVKNIDEGMELVATAARNFLKKYRPNGAPQGGQAGQPQSQPPNGGRQMSAASSAGRTGSGQQPTTPKSDVEVVFGADAR